MKKLLLSFVFLALTALPALAKDVAYQACTSDKVQAQLLVVLVDDVSDKVVKHIGEVFAAVAKSKSYEDLQSQNGYEAFAAQLTEEDVAAIEALQRPRNVGDCK